MASKGKHVHNFQVLSYSLEPRRTVNILYGCTTRPCINTEVRCGLCEDDGNRRRHKGHMKKLAEGDRTTLNRAILALTKAAMEYERLWGPAPKTYERPTDDGAEGTSS